MDKIRELEIIKSALGHYIIDQELQENELHKKRMNYPLEVDVVQYNEIYLRLSDTKRVHKKVSLELSDRLSKESRITSLERKIEVLEQQLTVSSNPTI